MISLLMPLLFLKELGYILHLLALKQTGLR